MQRSDFKTRQIGTESYYNSKKKVACSLHDAELAASDGIIMDQILFLIPYKCRRMCTETREYNIFIFF